MAQREGASAHRRALERECTTRRQWHGCMGELKERGQRLGPDVTAGSDLRRGGRVCGELPRERREGPRYLEDRRRQQQVAPESGVIHDERRWIASRRVNPWLAMRWNGGEQDGAEDALRGKARAHPEQGLLRRLNFETAHA